jgi:hypothetical protein
MQLSESFKHDFHYTPKKSPSRENIHVGEYLHESMINEKYEVKKQKRGPIYVHPSQVPPHKSLRRKPHLIMSIRTPHLEMSRSDWRTKGVQQDRRERNTKLGRESGVLDVVQEHGARRATRDRDAVEPIGQEVEDITRAGRGLSKMLTDRSANVSHRGSRVAELLHKRIGVGDGRDLVLCRFVHKGGELGGAVTAHGGSVPDRTNGDGVYG